MGPKRAAKVEIEVMGEKTAKEEKPSLKDFIQKKEAVAVVEKKEAVTLIEKKEVAAVIEKKEAIEVVE